MNKNEIVLFETEDSENQTGSAVDQETVANTRSNEQVI